MAQTLNLYREYPRPKGERLIFPSSSPFTAKSFLESQLEPHAHAQSTYESRVSGKNILLSNPLKESSTTRERKEKWQRRAKAKARKKIGVMGRSEAKLRGVWTLDPKDAKWDTFLALHHLWLGYMSELLNLPPRPPATNEAGSSRSLSDPNPASMQAKLVKADFHGAIVTVKDAKNKCLIGCSGIIFHETEGTFKVVTQANKVKVIPKRNSIFVFHIPLYSFDSYTPHAPKFTAALPTHSPDPLVEIDLYGNQFCFRSGDRSSKKFKPKETIEL